MEQCNVCGKAFPVVTLKEMVEIINGKAYYRLVCPACQMMAANSPVYYQNPRQKAHANFTGFSRGMNGALISSMCCSMVA